MSEWVWRIDSVNFASFDLDGFSSVDDDILTTETLIEEDIVTEVKINKTVHMMKRIYKKKKKKKKKMMVMMMMKKKKKKKKIRRKRRRIF